MNKYLEKIATRLSSEAKGVAKKLIDKARSSGKPAAKPGLLKIVMKPAQRGSFGDEAVRARKIAARATRDDAVRNSAKAGVNKAQMSKAAEDK